MKFSIILLSVFTACFAYSQQREIPYINSVNLAGVYNSGNEAFALIFIENRPTDRKDIYQISFFNEAFEKLFFEVEEDEYLYDVVSREGNSYFVFSSNTSHNFRILKLSKTHQLTQSTVKEPAPNDDFGKVNRAEINNEGNLFIFRPYSVWQFNDQREKKTIESGTEILAYDSDLSEVGSYRMNFDQQTRPTIMGFTPIEEGFVLTVETKDVEARQYDLNLKIFTNDLKLTGVYQLTENESFFPTEIISDNNQLVVAGYTLKGSLFESKDVEGLFVSTISLDGTLNRTSKYSWGLMTEKLQETQRGEFLFSGKMNVLVEKIIPSEGGYQIICESYENNSGKTIAEIAFGDNDNNRMVVVYDFVVFSTNSDGSLKGVKILEKEPMNIEIGAARMSKSSRIEFAYYMKKYQAFPFRAVEDGNISFVNYKNKIGYLSSLNMASGEIVQGDPILITPVIAEEVNAAREEFVANSSALTKLDNLGNKTDNLTGKLDRFGNKLDYSIEKVDLVFNPWGDRFSGMFFFDNGTSLGYIIDPVRHSVFFEPINP